MTGAKASPWDMRYSVGGVLITEKAGASKDAQGCWGTAESSNRRSGNGGTSM